MFKALYSRLKQGYRTMPFPPKNDVLSKRFAGLPCVVSEKCKEDCAKCKAVCPTDAISGNGKDISIDLGKCLFCTECQRACPTGTINFSREYRMAVRDRNDLLIRDTLNRYEKTLKKEIKNIFGRSLKLRQVSAGGCNACELDINVLNTLSFDLGRFGIQFVASPRHADGIVVTGPVTKNMFLALEKTYNAVPSPKLVIAVGACAISGGPYIDHTETYNGVSSILPVDLYIPGCPPHPLTILDGFLKIMKAM
ncbi:MAG: NADH-quinone oxidoreductase subunit NuoB [Candidatus Auribacterota bacterium]|jgi:Ni,Fe-hydrogenase III small subunit/NAD-dependent dihydropyrimidine dehydrogenase PreA subunit|nr:NADH-quinone oxidoreductase subunit NuoB [Candidatus Auribacterota bacterium]